MSNGISMSAGSKLGALGTLDLLINAATFCSLGVILPSMVQELHWNWSTAGLGFTILGACAGGSSMVPRYLIRKFGVRTTIGAGAILMFFGFLLLSKTTNLLHYYAGAAMCGVAYQSMTMIPATFVITRVFKHTSTAIGIYATLGALGNVLGPWMVLTTLGVEGETWRSYWMYQGVIILILGIATAIIIGFQGEFSKPAASELDEEKNKPSPLPPPPQHLFGKIYRTDTDWTPKQAMATPQFYILFASYALITMCLITITSLSVAHLTENGVSNRMAAGMLSLEASVAVIMRAVSGYLGDRMEPKKLLTAALLTTSIGTLLLANFHEDHSLFVYAIGTGIGFGTVQLCCTILLLNYFGRKYNLELFSTMLLGGAISAFGPLVGGIIRDTTGSFVPVFLILFILSLATGIMTLFMRPPVLKPSSERQFPENEPYAQTAATNN
ncbi:MFS transporter [Hirschia baltica]|uniref:Major facilitator superfamily MFS_1 n=1 Tax=Hirschia baltica (strain ATCC 49814 / DSM 5838 / IFAM 1418) TaxID=582402 RepID=C6XP32_HIRBI|nr:MFS transporter [Hirschia baltica]ACT60212.1 major facilitator superfamily MFS_1 [Hirschia baltica ATCC 49814]